MKITSKGQVAIPRAIRERFGFLPGTEVDFIVRGDAVSIVKTRARGAEIVRAMRGRANVGMTTAAVMKLTRGWRAGWKPA